MIDFRYHLVSIVAVFLALAIGLVLGSTELQGNTLDVLKTANNNLNTQLNATRAQRDTALQQANAGQAFAQANETALLKNLLAGERVVLITDDGADSGTVTAITSAAKQSGATITGTIALQSSFNSTTAATESTLSSVTDNQAQADTVTLGQTSVWQQAAQLIASASVGKASSPTVALTLADSQEMLKAYQQNGFISLTGAPANGATLAIIVAPATVPSDGASDQADQNLVAVAQEFADQSTATVVAGDTSGDGAGSAMSVLRSSGTAAKVSTIDDADTTIGQISTIQALATQAQGGKAGSYGVQTGATSGGPSPAPTPSASVSSSSSPSTSSTKKTKAKK
jgi:adenine/guanine phosphoribosyltransferase-like PRPP-binding protein